MAISTTIKRKFLDQKLKELEEKGFTYEYKATDDFWTKRVKNRSYPCDFVYVCGQRVVRLWATGYSVIDTPTGNGIPEVVPTPKCYAIKLENKTRARAQGGIRLMDSKKFDQRLNRIWADPRTFETILREVEKHHGRRIRWSDRAVEAITLFEPQNFGRKCSYRRDRGKKFAECRLTLDDCMPELCPYSPYPRMWSGGARQVE